MMRQTTRCAEIARFADTCFAAAGGVGLWRGEFATAQGETTAMSEDQAMARCEDQVNDSAMCDFSSGDCTSGERRCTVEASGCSPDKVIASMNPRGSLVWAGLSVRGEHQTLGARARSSEKDPTQAFPQGTQSRGTRRSNGGEHARGHQVLAAFARRGRDRRIHPVTGGNAQTATNPRSTPSSGRFGAKASTRVPLMASWGDRTRDAIQQCQSSRMEAGTGVLTRLQEHELTGCPPGTDGCYSWDR